VDRLNEDDPVLVTLPANAPNLPRVPLECHVLAVAGKTVALESFDKAITLRLPDVINDVYITFRSGDALVGLKGSLLVQSTPGDLRFVCYENEGRRRARPTRADVTVPLTIRATASDVAVEGLTVNMSLGGLLAECELEIAPGEKVEIGLRPPGREASITIEGMVVGGEVKRAGQRLIAIEFDPDSAKRHSVDIGRLVIEERRARRTRTFGQESVQDVLDF
jgi:hypothetical protein